MASNSESVGSNATDGAFVITTSMEQSVVTTPQIIHQVGGGKHQVLPFVYIQTPSKLSTPKSNVILNTMPQIQIGQNINKTGLPQSLIIGKQPIVLQKPQKNGVTYLTMLKPVGKTADTNLITTNRLPISAINKLKPDNFQNPQKFLITPMPKVTGNRLPVTATTNTVQPKISFMPLNIANNNKSKVFNFKIADGQIQQDNNSGVKVMCEEQLERCDEEEEEEEQQEEDKSYQISIVEDSNSRNDAGFTISINEDEKSKFETPKFSKHGVSILKKAYNFLDRKPFLQKELTPPANFQSITTVSDAGTKEVKIDEEKPPPPPPPPIKKSENRRKSTISLRKEFDEYELEPIVKFVDPKKKAFNNFMNYNTAFQKAIAAGIQDQDLHDVVKLLSWDDGIGTLPGSDLKFQMNEFGMLEYLTKDEFRKIIYRRQYKLKEERKKDSAATQHQEEMRCLECGCFGMPSEFISPRYCSFDCQTAGENSINKILKKKKRKSVNKNDSSDDENTSNDNSEDKFNYPWTCQKKGFSWSKYLNHVQAKAAPVKLFKDAFPYNRNGFRTYMKLEGVDPIHPSYFCVLSVAEVLGYRMRLHFDGYPDNYDFWVNVDSMDIFPVGFCEKFGHTLHPPPGFGKEFNWNYYLKDTRSGPPAPKQLFCNRNGNAIYPNGFRTGMKLEAVDRKNSEMICVATIRDLMDNRILVHFDSWDDIYDYWADPTSPYIHPVGWCDQHGHNLTPPNDYPSPETFTWERYLKETKSVAAPVRAFKQRPANGFKKGMRLECVDRRVPRLIRVATVDEVKDHQIRISFDGWPDRYCYWVDDDSSDIHPVGWCQKTGHPIEPPLTPDDVYDFLECATVGCRGMGHIRGPIFPTHSTQKNCPYAEENIDVDKKLPDRLLSPDRQIEAVVPVSREPKEKIKPRAGRPTKYAKIEIDDSKEEVKEEEEEEEEEEEWHEEDEDKFEIEEKEPIIEEPPEKRQMPVLTPAPFLLQSSIHETPTQPTKMIKKENYFEEDVNQEEQKMRLKHSKYLDGFIKCDCDPRDWTFEEVVEFVDSLPCCQNFGALFGKNKIDGISFLMLTQQDLIEILDFKLGPAISLYNCILLLRKSVINCT